MNFQSVVRLIEPAFRRISLMIGRGIVQSSKDDKRLQLFQLSGMADEVLDGVPRIGNYGFASRPKKGAEVIIVFPNGDRSHGFVIGVEDLSRLKNLAEGESALYSDEGDYLWLKRNRELHARANKFKFQGEAHELMERLVAALAKIEEGFKLIGNAAQTTVNTTLGPQPLTNAVAITAIGTAIEAIKTNIQGLKV